MHRIRTQPRDHEVDHHRGGEQLSTGNGHALDWHVLGVSLAFRLEESNVKRAPAQCRRHAFHHLRGDVLAPWRYPVVLHQIGDVAAQNLPAVGGCDTGEVGADAEHRLAAETRYMVRNPSVADHPPYDMQGRTQQMVQLLDARLEIVIES